MNGPIVAYLAYKFSYDPTKNTAEARKMAINIMKKHPDWFVIVPHYTCDAMLDGTVNWRKHWSNFDKWRRLQAGKMSFAFLSKCDMLILGCEPEYSESHGVTWEYIFTQILNASYRKDNPIKVIRYEEALK